MNQNSFTNFPENLDTKVWRYIDFTKYVSMLSTSSLFFARADKFEDKFEGASSKNQVESRRKFFERIQEMYSITSLDDLNARFWAERNLQKRKSVGICCWHMSEYESAAMWKIYLKSDDGVAIQTTFNKLNTSLKVIKGEKIYTQMVRYTNYDSEEIPETDDVMRFFYKRKSFDFEKEVRSVFCRPPLSENGKIIGLSVAEDNIRMLSCIYETIKNSGEYIKIDLNNLVENIVISPNTEDWFKILVIETTRKFGFDFTIKDSKLKETPAF